MSPRTTATLAALTLAVPLGLAGTAIAGDKGQGEEHRADAPGQQVREEHAAQPEAPQGQANGQENRAENPAGAPPAHAQNDDPKPARQQPAKQQAAKQKVAERKAARQTAPKSQGNGPKAKGNGPKAKGNGPAPQSNAGKITICHATGSESNPYVTITISNNAVKAHDRHQNNEDIIPAPAGGCPGGNGGVVNENGNGGKVTICHATGSETNPFVVIEIDDSAVKAHENHQEGQDIIPAPANGVCVTPTLPTLTETLTTLTEKLTTLTTPPTNPPAALTPAGNVLGDFAEGGPDEAADNQVAPGGANGADATDRRESGADAAAASGGELPFTGLELAIVAALGFAAMLAGVAMRRSLGRNAG